MIQGYTNFVLHSYCNDKYKWFLEYRKGEDGLPEVVKKVVKIALRIYRLFLEEKTPYGIVEISWRMRYPPRQTRKWQTSTILSILINEKYKGDAL